MRIEKNTNYNSNGYKRTKSYNQKTGLTSTNNNSYKAYSDKNWNNALRNYAIASTILLSAPSFISSCTDNNKTAFPKEIKETEIDYNDNAHVIFELDCHEDVILYWKGITTELFGKNQVDFFNTILDKNVELKSAFKSDKTTYSSANIELSRILADDEFASDEAKIIDKSKDSEQSKTFKYLDLAFNSDAQLIIEKLDSLAKVSEKFTKLDILKIDNIKNSEWPEVLKLAMLQDIFESKIN